MGLGEQVHHPICSTFLKLRLEDNGASDELLLNIACKAHNDSSGLNGLVPKVLVFGSFSRMPVRSGMEDEPTNTDRVKMHQTAIAEFNKYLDKFRLDATSKSQAPTDPDSLFPYDRVLVWRKDPKS